MKYKAIAFDIDGTLYPNWCMYLRSLPFALTHISLIRAFARVRKELRSIRPITDFLLLQAEMVGNEMGISAGDARRLIDTHLYREWELVLKKVPLYPGVVELLTNLRDSGYRLAVASDFPVERKLEILGLSDMWDFSLSTEDTNYLKPNPEPFLEISANLGIPPQDILYVGNSLHYDVLGAKSVGMHAAHLTRHRDSQSPADFSFQHYQQLSQFLLSPEKRG